MPAIFEAASLEVLGGRAAFANVEAVATTKIVNPNVFVGAPNGELAYLAKKSIIDPDSPMLIANLAVAYDHTVEQRVRPRIACEANAHPRAVALIEIKALEGQALNVLVIASNLY